MNELNKKALYTDLPTATGKTVAENIKNCRNLNPDVIRPIDNPIAKPVDWQSKGNLAPEGGVVKRSAVAPEMLKHNNRQGYLIVKKMQLLPYSVVKLWMVM